MRIVVKRSEWYRGHLEGSRLLREEDGQKCCVGFACLAAGLTLEDIHNVSIVSSIWPHGLRKLAKTKLSVKQLANKTDGWLDAAYKINDQNNIDDKEREAKLIALGAKHGHEFVFVG